jgi:large subunit GTPase 1
MTLQRHRDNKQRLRVPRRPPWTKDLAPAQLERQEKDAFLVWRRGLAECVSRRSSEDLTYHLFSIAGFKNKTSFF